MNTFVQLFVAVYENDVDALKPELWAQESLVILEENMVLGNLVHRDYSSAFASYGDVVNIDKPQEFEAVRKTDADEVTVQDANADSLQVKLDQHFHTSFMIKDGQETKSWKDLVNYFLRPAILSIAQAVDKAISGSVIQFAWTNGSGTLGTAPTSTSPFLEVRNIMNKNKCPVSGRKFVLTPDTETAALALDIFQSAERVGDNGTALREASLGRKLGFDFFMAQNQPTVTRASGTASSTVSTTIKAANAAAKGATTIVCTSNVGGVAGQIVDIGGDPQYVLAVDGGGENITICPGLRAAKAAGTAVTFYKFAKVNLGAGYAAGYAKELVIDTITDFVVGQPVIIHPTEAVAGSAAAAAALPRGVVIGTSAATSILLDRPLDAASVDNSFISPYPVGNYNFAFTKNAVALVTRPLQAARSGTGALSATASYNNLGVRVTITYNGTKQGHLVTVDLLCGVTKLDDDQGAVLFA